MTDAAASAVASTPTWLAFCGKMAPLSSMLTYMAPVPTVLELHKRKSVGSLPLLPYTAMLSNAFLWVVYGLLVNEPKLVAPNVLGAVMGLYYFSSFILTAPKGMKSSTLPGSINLHIFFFIAVVAFVLHYANAEKRLPIGQLGVLINLAMFASPLAAVKTVLDTKTSEAIPLPLTVASFMTCVFWTMTGYFDMHDPYVWLPPAIGIIFGLMQISLKLVYPEEPQTAKLSADLNSAKMKLS